MRGANTRILVAVCMSLEFMIYLVYMSVSELYSVLHYTYSVMNIIQHKIMNSSSDANRNYSFLFYAMTMKNRIRKTKRPTTASTAVGNPI